MFRDSNRRSQNFKVTCKLLCCQSCTFCNKKCMAAAKERLKSSLRNQRNKFCELCFFCRSLLFCPKCDKCPQCCSCPTSRRAPSALLANLGPPGCKSESSVHFEGRLHSPIQNQTSSGKGSFDSQWLCKPPQEPLPEGGFAGLTAKGGSRDGEGSNISSLLQPTVHSSKTKPKMATNLGPQCSKQIFERKNIQNGNPRNNSDFLATIGMSDIAGFQRRLFPDSSSFEVPDPSLWPLHSPDGVHLCGQRGQVNGSIPGYKDPPVPRRLVDSSPYQRILPPGHSIAPQPLPGVGLDSQPTKVRTRTQTDFRVRGLQVRSLSRTGLTDSEPLGVDPPKVLESILSKPSCRVRKFMSLIGLLTATEKQVPLGRLHMRPIQWHLKRHWRVPESLEKEIPVPRSLHPQILWWTKETNVLTGQPLHPLSHAVQIFTDASKEGWGAHLGDFTARDIWSVPESHLHIIFLELKAVLLALKRFQHLIQGKVVLVATDNTTVVAYINKEGGMRSGSLCALLWRLLCWCNLRQVVLKARHIPGRLNVIADKLSRQGQVIQTEWSLHQEVFDLLVQTWHRPQVDMFATKYNCKLAHYVSPVPDPSAWAVDALTVSWENLDMYVFPPVSLLGKVVSKLLDHLYKRVILIAPGWPNMPWFWDLVELSSQIPLCLPSHPDLVTQPFNKARHRNLTNLNLHAWLLEPRLSRSKGSLAQWRQELRLLKEVQPEQSMRQSGPFLSDGVNQVMWTSGLHLSNRYQIFSYIYSRRRISSPVPLMVTDQPLRTN